MFEMPHRNLAPAVLALAAACLAVPAHAGSHAQNPPFWGALREQKVYMRVGPGQDYGIRFIYERQHLPVRVLRVWQGWYFVEDPDGSRGWMLAKFVSGEHTGLVKGRGGAEIHAKPDGNAPVLWKLAPGIIGRLGDCADGWCRFDVDKHAGFVPASRVWGAGAP